MNISIEDPVKLFDHHLSKKDNRYVLFSAPFGYGKTFFLNSYFKNIKYYNTFWLSPIKYAVGQNEDIFEYIKADIALQLLSRKELQTKEQLEFTQSSYAQQYLSSNPLEVVQLLFQGLKDSDIPIVKTGASIISSGFEIKKKFEEWREKLSKEVENDFIKLVDFSTKLTLVKGSIYEDDIISQIIRLSLISLKEDSKIQTKNKSKENILIIDDFDRLDPEHIFRILNILSVHSNYINDENKFGFDKILIVCSIDNIKNIYEHKYGKNVDFNGYIEKFYSTDIFRFDNQNTIAYYCQHHFGTDIDDELMSVLGVFLSFFVKNHKLSIRSIVKSNRVAQTLPFRLCEYQFPPKVKEADSKFIYERQNNNTVLKSKYVWGNDYIQPITRNTETFFIDSSDFDVLEIIQILVTVFGDFNSLNTAVNDSKEQAVPFQEKYTKLLIRKFLPLIHYITQYNDVEKILFTENNKQYTVPMYEFVETALTLDLPSTEILYHKIYIPLGWNFENQYDGSAGYYSLIEDNFSDEIDYTAVKSNLESQLLNFLRIILKHLGDNNHLKNVGVSK